MKITNTEEVPGYKVIEIVGLVEGSTVRAKHIGKDIMAGLKGITGGEMKEYTELLNESRQEAVKRMSLRAEALGANAILNVRFSTSSVAQGAAELFAYGSAAIVEKNS
ncbi:hypothetical protein CL645_04630 [bacterium]|nr:hypothetical protein [bacterium]|tara:strand:+ start:95 stop:418 length:324 start_codon:yes stop_codon:yes gene_type:complete